MLNRIGPIIEDSLPKELAGLRANRGCVEQVLSLTTNIENGFQKKLNSFVVFTDFTAAYDTVCRQGLLLKFIKIIPDKQLYSIMSNILSKRYFQVVLNENTSKFRRLNKGLPQGPK